MTFPTIPTVAAGRVLTLNQTNFTQTRTFPSLTGLTKNSGDLLIAIAVGFNSSVGTTPFTNWGAGFTSFHNSGTEGTARMVFGCAYKWSDGTETGTFTVTQANTVSGDASMILLSIPGAHPTTPPEAGGRTQVTGAASAAIADPTAVDPAGWDVEDTLWIALHGSGEVQITGSYTGVTAPPANYTNYVDTGISADKVGGIEAAVAFRQLAAASEDAGAFTGDASYNRTAAIVIAVRPAPPATGFYGWGIPI